MLPVTEINIFNFVPQHRPVTGGNVCWATLFSSDRDLSHQFYKRACLGCSAKGQLLHYLPGDRCCTRVKLLPAALLPGCHCYTSGILQHCQQPYILLPIYMPAALLPRRHCYTAAILPRCLCYTHGFPLLYKLPDLLLSACLCKSW